MQDRRAQFAGHDRIGERSRTVQLLEGMRPLRHSSGILIAEVLDRAAEHRRSSTGGILLDGGPFDTAQGSYAVAVAELVEAQGSYFTLERNFFQVSWI